MFCSFCLISLWNCSLTIVPWWFFPPWNSILLWFLWQLCLAEFSTCLCLHCGFLFPWDLYLGQGGYNFIPFRSQKIRCLESAPLVAIFLHLWNSVLSRKDWSQADTQWSDGGMDRESAHWGDFTVFSSKCVGVSIPFTFIVFLYTSSHLDKFC